LLPVLRSAMARNPAERPTAVGLVQLTRRIHIEATITDQTPGDQHHPPAAPPQEQPPPDHSRQPPIPPAGPPPHDAPGRPAQPGPTAIPAAAPTPAPVPAQPSDFVGQLPPAAPPPVPPPGPAPYKAGEQFRGGAYAPPPDPYAQGGYPPQ